MFSPRRSIRVLSTSFSLRLLITGKLIAGKLSLLANAVLSLTILFHAPLCHGVERECVSSVSCKFPAQPASDYRRGSTPTPALPGAKSAEAVAEAVAYILTPLLPVIHNQPSIIHILLWSPKRRTFTSSWFTKKVPASASLPSLKDKRAAAPFALSKSGSGGARCIVVT